MNIKRHLFKITCIGDKLRSKPSFLNKYLGNFDNHPGLDFSVKKYIVQNEEIVIEYYIPDPLYKYDTVKHQVFSGNRGLILCFDLDDITTLQSLPSYVNDAMMDHLEKPYPVLLLGFEAGTRHMDFDVGRQYAKDLSDWLNQPVYYGEIDVKNNLVGSTGKHLAVEELFIDFVELVYHSTYQIYQNENNT